MFVFNNGLWTDKPQDNKALGISIKTLASKTKIMDINLSGESLSVDSLPVVDAGFHKFLSQDDSWLTGFFLGDGYRQHRKVLFQLKKERKIDALRKILERNKIDYRDKLNNRGVHTISFNLLNAPFLDSAIISTNSHEKSMKDGWCLGIDPTSASKIIDGLLDSDGSQNSINVWDYYSESQFLKAQIGLLALKSGLRFRMDKSKYNRVYLDFKIFYETRPIPEGDYIITKPDLFSYDLELKRCN